MEQFLKKLIKLREKKEILEISFLFLIGAVSLTWFKDGFFVWGGDTTVPLNLSHFLRDYLYYISSKIAFSLPDVSKFAFLFPVGFILHIFDFFQIPFSPFIFQKIIVYFLFSFSGISLYFLFKTLFPNSSSSARVLAGLFYMFNFYSFVLWHSFSWIVFYYAFFPLVLALFIKGINQEKKVSFFIKLAFLATILLTPSYTTPPFAFIFWFIIILYLIFYSLLESNWQKVKKSFLSTFWLCITWSFLNIFWILTQILFLQSELTRRGLPDDSSSLLNYNSSFLVNIFRFLGPEFLAGGFKKLPFYPWFDIYNSHLLILIGFSISLLVFSSFLSRSRNKELLFFGLLTLFFIFLTAGTNSPFPQVNSFIFSHFEMGTIFRSLWQRFMGIVILGTAILLGFVVDKIFVSIRAGKIQYRNFLKYSFTPLIFIFFIGIYAFPIWTDKVFPERESKNLFSGKIKIPSSYYETAKWLDSQPGNFNILPLPFPRMGLAAFSWEKRKEGFSGTYPLIFLSEKRFLITDFGNEMGKQSVNDLLDGKIKDAHFLNFFNIRYIIFHKDASWGFIKDNDWFVSRNKEDTEKVLNSIQGLKKEKTFGNLEIYSNSYWEPSRFYLSSKDILYDLNSLDNLISKYDFVENILKKDFNFISKKDDNSKSSIKLNNLFTNIKPADIFDDGSKVKETVFIDSEKNINTIYENKPKQNLYYSLQDNQIEIYSKSEGNLLLNGETLNFPTNNNKSILYTFKIEPNKNYYLSMNNLIFLLKPVEKIFLGQVQKGSELKLFLLGEAEFPFNGSFEQGLWQEKVGDCYNYDNNPILDMKLNNEEKTDGQYSLELEAKRHIACTFTDVEVKGNTEYLFSFDYQGENAEQVGYYLEFSDEKKTVISEKLDIKDSQWKTFSKKIKTPIGATRVILFVYAYSTGGITSNIVRYDNFKFFNLELAKLVEEIRLPEIENDFEKLDLNGKINEGENIFEFSDNYRYDNLFKNHSFEQGLWQEKVEDCDKLDNNPILAMKLNNEEKTDGQYSLELEAKRHIACTFTDVEVKGNTEYLFSFDYQGENAKQVGYYLGFNDEKETGISEKLEIKDSQWQTFDKKVKTPIGATRVILFVYAYSTGGITSNIVRYDNFKLVEIPDFDDRYYLVSDPHLNLKNPEKVDFEIVNPTKKIVHIKSASTPFFLSMSEAYHPQWQLEINNQKINGTLKSWLPFTKPDKISDDYHLKLDDFLNAWYVDVNELKDKGLVKQNPDGTYDIEMVIEFWPQRWFYLGLIISSTTLLSCLGYLTYDFSKRKKWKKKLEEKLKFPV